MQTSPPNAHLPNTSVKALGIGREATGFRGGLPVSKRYANAGSNHEADIRNPARPGSHPARYQELDNERELAGPTLLDPAARAVRLG